MLTLRLTIKTLNSLGSQGNRSGSNIPRRSIIPQDITGNEHDLNK
jgi:hypothetical protein